jgi:hypothetical protein
VNWEANRIAVQSPKTERHGKATRIIPLFPELKPHLERSFELAPEGAVYVVDERYRKASLRPGGRRNANLRTTFEKIFKPAGLEPWPRLFQNLRASRETELVDRFPVQTVVNWLGNTPTVALKHYLMTPNDHFERAVRGGHESANETTQKTTQQVGRNASQYTASGQFGQVVWQ